MKISLLFISALFCTQLFSQSTARYTNNGFVQGTTFKPFSLTDMNGNVVNLAELSDKVIVLNFWFINCNPCRKEIPELSEMAEEYKNDSRVGFYAVALDGKEQLEVFLQKLPFSYTILPNGRSVAAQYSITGFPTNVVVDRNSKIAFVSKGYGPGTVHELERAVKKSLNDR